MAWEPHQEGWVIPTPGWPQQPKPQARFSLIPFRLDQFSSRGCAAAFIPQSSQHLQCKEAASTVRFGKPRGRFLTGASQYSFTEGLGATLVHPKKGLAQRDKETHCSPSVDMEVGHPGFPVQQHCWHSWKSHLAINLAPMSWAMKRPSPQSQQKVSHFP